MTPRLLVRRLLALVNARRLDTQLDDEVRAHLELAERDQIAAGLSPEDARRAARRSFGSTSPAIARSKVIWAMRRQLKPLLRARPIMCG